MIGEVNFILGRVFFIFNNPGNPLIRQIMVQTKKPPCGGSL
jgi:hypothetical protein